MDLHIKVKNLLWPDRICVQIDNNTDILHCHFHEHLDILVQNYMTDVKFYCI